MKQSLRILIVDDHPMIVRGYEMAILNGFTGYSFEIESASSSDGVISNIKNHRSNFYNIVLLDIGIPAASNLSFKSGEDLGLLIRSYSPQTK